MSLPSFSLTDQMDVKNGAHILYFYSSHESYLDNAAAFLQSGINLGQHVVLVDSEENYRDIRARLRSRLADDTIERIHYVHQRDFYCEHGILHISNIMKRFTDVFTPKLEDGVPIRSWGNVYWEGQEDIFEQLQTYEHQCDEAIYDMSLLGVCVYDGKRVPVDIQNKMLQYHEYFMTDATLTKSMLYPKTERKTIFPSLSIHTRMQSEVDFYKQKLEFVHVISHEVRNPLTVINAYASLLMDQPVNEEGRRKLQTIIDYVHVIDNEMHLLINTEQLLSAETRWQKSPVEVKPVVAEVVHMMSTKARTQSIGFDSRLMLDSEQILGNRIGLKLLVSNLLSNAIKYSHEGGIVKMTATADDKHVCLIVEDHGIGMSRRQLANLFQMYERMNEEKTGQGIGLYMAKQLTNHFRGDIAIRSEPNEGTQVTVTLPLC
jgi:anti-sigma regulatory factor (Ser/Thr protein kinase)